MVLNDKRDIIVVENLEGDVNTVAEIVAKNKIKYIPKVSVIIPVYNVDKYLRESLECIVNQTLQDIEVICVDDGSTDNSLDILKEYAKKDDRITVLKQDNLYAGVARNAGMMVAKGKYLSFLDSDDEFELDMLRSMYEKAEQENSEIVICKYVENNIETSERRIYGYNENLYNIYKRRGKEFVCDKIYNMTSPVPWNKMYNREFICKNNIKFQNIKIANDVCFWMLVLGFADKISVVDNIFIQYRRCREGGLTKNRESFKLLPFQALCKVKKILDKAGLFDKLRRSFFERLVSNISMVESWGGDKHRLYLSLLGFWCSNDTVVFNKVEEIIKKKSKNTLREYREKMCNLDDEKLKNIDSIFNERALISSFNNREYFKYLFNERMLVEDYLHKTRKPNYCFVHGSGTWYPQLDTMNYAKEEKIPLIKIEDGFLRSADTWCNSEVDKKFTHGISFTFTNDVFYFDATQSSFIERQIADETFVLSKDEEDRVKKLIKIIVDNNVTKYNHQPIYTPKIGRNGVKKVLVVDQSYGDFSIKKGLASEKTFKDMLEAAIKENPNADIIVKTHPDALAPGSKRATGYYSSLEDYDNVFVLREPVNPISLLKSVDKVYVCTTQFGFEALMCGKEVHVFGMPFYAGWGLTIDRQTCERRTVKRTLEELFYIVYIKNSFYVDPVAKRRCSIEKAIEYLIGLRKEYEDYKKGIVIYEPKCSIIICAYNGEKYLHECLDSVVNQTLQDIEVICVDDGSTDNTLDVFNEYAKRDDRFKIISQKNAGLSCGRNRALEMARGKYIVFLDADDYLRYDAIDVIFNKMEQNKLDMLSYSGLNFDDSTRKMEINNYWEYAYLPSKFDKENYNYKKCSSFMHRLDVSSCLTAYRRILIEEKNIYFPEHLCFEDNVFYLKAITQAKSCGIIRDKLYFRRIHGDAITQNWNKHFSDYLEISSIILEYLKNFDKKLFDNYKKSYLDRCVSLYNSFNEDEQYMYNADLMLLLKKYCYKVKKRKKNNKIYLKKKIKWFESWRKKLFSVAVANGKKSYCIMCKKITIVDKNYLLIREDEKMLAMLYDVVGKYNVLHKKYDELKKDILNKNKLCE